MTLRRILLLGLTTLMAGPVWAQDKAQSTWKLGTDVTNAKGELVSSTAAGPFWMWKKAPDGSVTQGVRPFWIQTKDAQGTLRQGLSIYPIFSYRGDDETYQWSVFELIKRSGRKDGAPPPQSTLKDGEALDIWPFWFSRTGREPEDNYKALFPIYGTIKSRFGFDRLHWTIFPLYVRSEKRGAITTSAPWPFIRVTRGEAHGFALWPLFGWKDRPDVSKERFYLWPLGYNNTKYPSPEEPLGTPPVRQIGALPFYAKLSAPGYINEDYLWPFFGYTDRTKPVRYHETRYFWPFFVQGHGDEREVNRWGPFYTHSIIKGTDKTWIMWPVYRQAKWTEKNIAQTKTQFLYFLYWSLDQRSATNPNVPHAYVRHIWPVFSQWDNGAGRRQLQVLSPFEVLFPNNQKVRDTWSPFFALYKYDQRSPGNDRHSLLWDIITWEHRTPAAPATTDAASPVRHALAPREERLSLGRGLIGLRRPEGERAWRLFWLDFKSKQSSVSTASAR
jgi:hypothetical protein